MNRNLKNSILSILLGAALCTQTVKAKEFTTAEVAAQTMSKSRKLSLIVVEKANLAGEFSCHDC